MSQEKIHMMANPRCDNKTYHLGYFTDELAAAKAYDKAAQKYHGEFASLNFPTTDTSGKGTYGTSFAE